MNHTPGPWEVEVLEEITASGERRPASYISSSQGWAKGKRTIAIVGHWRDRPNPEADARLIAAAPELLEALGRIRDYSRGILDEKLEGQEHLDPAWVWRVASDAIRKARE